jgi:hypothetical protein
MVSLDEMERVSFYALQAGVTHEISIFSLYKEFRIIRYMPPFHFIRMVGGFHKGTEINSLRAQPA